MAKQRKEAGPVTVAGRSLKCPICSNTRFFERKAQLNTSVATFFSFDWLNTSAKCAVCSRCGYIQWFLPLKD